MSATHGAANDPPRDLTLHMDGSPLRQSINDAQVLLWYATREGKTFPAEIAQTIADTDALLNSGKRDTALESRFWSDFRDLAAAMQPVTVDSVGATYGYPFGSRRMDKGLGDAKSTKRRYSTGAIVVLTLLLLMQIYWYIGTAFRTDLEKNRAELDSISGALREMMLKSFALDERIKAMNVVDSDNNVKPIEVTPSYIVDLEELKTELGRIELEFVNKARRLERLNLILAGDECLLYKWDFVTADLFSSHGNSSSVSSAGINPDPCGVRPNRELSNMLKKLWSPDVGGHVQAPVLGNVDAGGIGAATRDATYREIISQIYTSIIVDQQMVELSLEGSKSTLAILNQYILPLLYGVLGSLAYTLRALSLEIQNVTFTRGSDIRYSLRWPLGMLAGITVGLFFDPAKLSGLAAITPLGLAFLAGYGVELVFTGLDKLVRAFTGSDSEVVRPA
jgi:hypothetical protein